jgi:hypothetical protein
MTSDHDTQTYANDSATSSSIGTGSAQSRSPDVLRDLLVKRNLAEQSKWLNDETGDRSWAVHPTQDIRWWMNVQVEALAGGK